MGLVPNLWPSPVPIGGKGPVGLVLVVLHATLSSCLEVVLLCQIHEACKKVLSEHIPSNEPVAKQRIVTSGKRRSNLLKNFCNNIVFIF